MSSKRKHLLILFFILVLAAILRFYRLYDMAHYNSDQAYASQFVWSVVREFPVQMVGQGLSIMGLFMGPWYFYFLVPFYLLTGLHPLGGYIGSIIIGLTTIIAFYYIARYFFNSRTGLILAFIQAISPVAITTDWQMTPAFSSIIIVMVTWFLFHQYWQGKTKTLPLLAFVFGLYTSFHPIQFPLYFVFLGLVIIRRHIPSFKTALLSLVAFLIPVSPLIAFEYFRKFAITKQVFAMFTSSTASSFPNFARMPHFLRQLPIHISQTFGTFRFSLDFTTVAVIIAIIYLILSKTLSKTKNFHLVTITLTFIAFAAYYSFFPGNVSEYYFNALAVLTLFYFVAFLGSISTSKLGMSLLVIILVNASLSSYMVLNQQWTANTRMALSNKDAIVKEIVKYQENNPPREFFVSHIFDLGSNFGYNYLFKLYGHIPQTREAVDPIYTIVTPKRLSPGDVDFTSGGLGLILPREYE